LKEHLNTSQLVLLGVLLFVNPMSFRDSSQLMTAGPGIFYAISACFMLSKFPKRSYFSVIVAAFLFFCAYGAHANYVSFAAGGFLWLAFIYRSWKFSLIFAFTLMGLLILESLFFNYLSNWELLFGRVERLFFSHHGISTPGQYKRSVAFEDLFTRWLDIPTLNIILSVLFFAAGPAFVYLRKRTQLPGFVSCVYLAGLCFALSVSFAVRGIDPLQPFQRLHMRYLSPFMPFAIIVSVYFLSVITQFDRTKWISRMEKMATIIVISIFVFPQVSNFSKAPIKPQAFIWRADHEYSAFSKQYYKGNLILYDRKKYVLNWIARFKKPKNNQEIKPGQAAKRNTSEVKCVRELSRVPLYKNYHECRPADLDLSASGVKEIDAGGRTLKRYGMYFG
jgi:hypothetical protein